MKCHKSLIGIFRDGNNPNRKTILFICLIYMGFYGSSQTVSPARIDDKVICGYQGWFSCPGDGSPVDSWFHWQWNQSYPSPGFVSFDLYPDVSSYYAPDLCKPDLGNLGDGTPALLFSSYSESVINRHFGWMQVHGIDGVALQRFIVESFHPQFKENRDSVAVRVARAAEEFGRIFYIVYDLNDLDSLKLDSVKRDWQNHMVSKLQITSSSAYAHHNKKPIVGIWGIGFTHISITASKLLQLIKTLKKQGFFVVGGVPTYWREGINDSRAGFEEVYNELDMISPWTIGRYDDLAGIDNYRDNVLIPDRDHCNNEGIIYQPVIYPGFAWSNWNGGSRNQIPRLGGDFLWRQAYNIRQEAIASVYLAMFDEYDEGTAIMPAADSYFSIPTSQYFLTYSSDGMYRSADFYLRLAGEVTQMIAGEIPLSTTFNTSPYAPPHYFRTSFEAETDAQPNWINTIDESTIQINTNGFRPGSNPYCKVTASLAYSGSNAIHILGEDNSDVISHAYFKVFDVNIPVTKDSHLSYQFYPLIEGGRNVSVDLIMTDGTTLRDSDAVDLNGNDMHPGNPKGIIGEWSKIECNIGNWLKGKVIDRIMIAYDYAPETRYFFAYIDDIKIFEKKGRIRPLSIKKQEPLYLKIYPNPLKNEFLCIDIGKKADQKRTVYIRTIDGKLIFQESLNTSHVSVDTTNWPKGIYLVKVLSNGQSETRKLILE